MADDATSAAPSGVPPGVSPTSLLPPLMLAAAALLALLCSGSGPAELPRLPPWLGAAVLVVLAGPWWQRAPPDRSGRIGRWLLPLVAVLLLVDVGLPWGGGSPWQGPGDRQEWARRAEAGYQRAWQELDGAAEALAAGLGPQLATHIDRDDRSLDALDARRARSGALLRLLAELGSDDGELGAITAILLDADQEAVAWHGPGLLHEPAGWELPKNGRDHRRSQTAATLLSVREIATDRRPWRILVGRSHTYDDFPFAPLPDLGSTPGLGTEVRPIRWSIADGPGGPGGPGMDSAGDAPADPAAPRVGRSELLRLGDGPYLYLDLAERDFAGRDVADRADAEAREGARSRESEWAVASMDAPGTWAAILAALLAIFAGLRALFAAPTPGSPPWRRSARVILPLATGCGCAAAISGAAPAVVLATGLATALWGGIVARVDQPGSSRFLPAPVPAILPAVVPAILAASGWLLLLLASRFYQQQLGAIDLSDFERGGPDVFWLRLAVGTVPMAFLLAIRGAPAPTRPEGDGPGGSAFFAAIALGIAAAAFVDAPSVAIPLGLLSAAAGGVYRHLRSSEARLSAPAEPDPKALGAAVLLASILGIVAWQVADRMEIKERLEEVHLAQMAPPTGDELNAILVELDGAVAELDLASILPPPLDQPSELRDLAFVLWRRLPLSARDGLSALLVEGPAGERSSFAFGLAVDGLGVPLPDPARWSVPNSAAWQESLLEGEGELKLGDRAWGRVRYWFLPRPGFRGSVDETEELERNLVRGKPRRETADGLPPEVHYALFDLDGRAISSPWDEAPPLPREVLISDVRSGRLRTPEGLHWFWLDSGIDGIEALFLPVLGPREALERSGFAVVGLLPVLLLLVGVGWLGGAPRPELAELVRANLRSYSRRLSLVYTVLLLLPLIALNLVLLRSFAERLQQEQLAEAQNAMLTARTLLVDYLQGLGPGFLIETQVNRELLEWIGGLVQHQVNLYWGSRLYASSQQELFTAGLLPHRIPGEIFDRLTLLGYDMEFRRQRAGDLAYLEVYAPFDVPGIVSSQQGLFLSVPLLEQEEVVARQLTVLRRRALLITTGLFLVLLAVGGRLSRSFTRPIVQLIEGTRRIARGEPFGKLEPKETELSALATAIGAMADQVELGRRRLRSEKRFVERVVANITSAVVSIDGHGQVLLQNSLAAERLGTREGEPLDDRLAADPALRPIREFVAEVRELGQVAGRQVKLRPTGEKVDVLEWTLTWVPIPGDEDPASLLVVDDATEVLRGQRLEAWAEMARIIAHEIKNPLTPIRLSTEHLRQVWRSDPDRFDEVVERCTANILSNVEELRLIASEFSIYSRIPKADPEPGDLVAFAAELVANYEHAAASDSGASTRFVASKRDADEGGAGEEEVWARFDAKLLGRAIRNLLENARRAAGQGGTVEVSIATVEGEGGRPLAQIRVLDSGPGVDPQKLERIFEPYFSTYETGTGLGLAITRRIVDEHGGTIEARNRPDGGLAVLLTIPKIAPVESPTGSSDSVS